MSGAPLDRATWRLATITAFGAFMGQLDTSVVNVGLETIGSQLHSGLAGVQWVISAYLVALGAALPLSSWLMRRVGPGQVWLACMAGFTVASGICALAPTLGVLVGARVLQGLAAGLILPVGQTMMGRSAGSGQLGRMMATLGVPMTLAPAFGPVLGGLLIHVASWRWLFAINLPLGCLAFGLGVRHIPRGGAEPTSRPDLLGLVPLTVGVPLLVLGATLWGTERTLLRPEVWIALGAGALGLVWFALRSAGRRDAVVDLGLLARPAYRAALATTTFGGAAMFGGGVLLPLYFQLGRGASPLATGVLLISMSAGIALALPLTGRLTDRYGGGVVSLVGGLGALVTTLPFTFIGTGASELVVQPVLLLRGAALACAVMPVTTAAYKALDHDQLADGTTLANLVQRVGGALGSAIFSVILAARLSDGHQVALHAAFAWLSAASVLGVLGSAWLCVAEGATAAGGRRRLWRPEGVPSLGGGRSNAASQ